MLVDLLVGSTFSSDYWSGALWRTGLTTRDICLLMCVFFFSRVLKSRPVLPHCPWSKSEIGLCWFSVCSIYFVVKSSVSYNPLLLGTLCTLSPPLGVSNDGSLLRSGVVSLTPGSTLGDLWDPTFLSRLRVSFVSSISSLLPYGLSPSTSFPYRLWTFPKGSSEADSWLVVYIYSFDELWPLSDGFTWSPLSRTVGVVRPLTRERVVGLTFQSSKCPTTPLRSLPDPECHPLLIGMWLGMRPVSIV